MSITVTSFTREVLQASQGGGGMSGECEGERDSSASLKRLPEEHELADMMVASLNY